jgi:non-specific serine/threonine protein kinase
MVSDASPSFSTVLRSYRLAAGLSQQELAERAGLSLRAVSDLERGRRRAPYPDTVRRLARALRLTTAERARLEAASRRQAGASGITPPGPDRVTNLPIQVTSFVGREQEMVEVERLLAATRLLTLTGAGGCGKTRLALQVAGSVADAHADGVWLVDLAPLTDPTLVGQAVAAALGLQESTGQPIVSRLLAVLTAKRLLLVLDNCEHLIEACARLADALLRGCPGVTILATSREPLGIAGEVAWRVPSLSLPAESDTAAPSEPEDLAVYEAIRLFVERTASMQPRFTLTPQNAPAVVQICRRLDGIPLAIELAAARTRMLTVEQIAARLDDRFRLLTGGGRTSPSRQQTLRATNDWSHDLLTGSERALFRRLAVFAGGWTLEAAEAVGAGEGVDGPDVLDVLGQLVEKSLVLVDEAGAEARYRLLETVRQYAAEKLEEAGEEANVRARHAGWCLALTERAERRLEGADQLVWFARLDAERDNLRAALEWSLDADPQAGLRLAGGIWPFWQLRAHYAEGERWLDNVIARAPEPTAPRAKALLGAGLLARAQARKTIARAWLEEALPLCRALGDRRQLALALRELGYLLGEQGDRARGRALLEEGFALARADGDERGLGAALFMLAGVAAQDGNAARARALGEASLLTLRRVGDRWLLGRALGFLGIVALEGGDCARARALWEEALPLAQALGAPNLTAVHHVRLGWAALWQGDAERAEAHYESVRTLAERHALPTSLAHALTGLGRAAQVRGDGARATALLAESLAIHVERGATQGIGEAQYGLGLAARDLGDWARATICLRESLAVRRAADDRTGIATCLEGLATVAAEQGRPDRTARLLGAAEALRRAIGSPMPPVERPAFEAAARTARAALSEAAFAAAWAEGRMLPLEEAIAEALAPDEATAGAPRPAEMTSGDGPAVAVAPPPSADGLTRREVEVLRLIAAGRSNRAIAAELALSVRTVERHITNLYGKIGAANRADATAHAFRRGLA